MTDEKTVQISGTTNRYQINKLKKEPKCIKLRKATEKMGLPEEYFLLENQSAIIKDLFHETQNMIEPQYNKMIIEAYGGTGDNDMEKENKIIHNIAKNVLINKGEDMAL
jgi:hypothetical protein